MADGQRLFVKVTRESLPQVKDKYPFLYLERGRLEVDDSSIKWIDASNHVVPLPVATLNALLLGPGTSITHDAVRTTTAANCSICWVGEDSLLFYAAGFLPTADTRNLKRQIELATDAEQSLAVARRMFARRFPDAALYGLLCSAIHSMGYSPHIGFIHSGSPLPFVYDMADIYKEHLCIDLAFSLTRELAGRYDKHKVADAFRKRVLEMNLLEKIGTDMAAFFGVGRARRAGE